MEKQKKAYLFAGIAVFFWSTVASAFKIALRHFDFLQLLFFASLTSIVILFFILLFQNKLNILITFSYKDYLRSAFLGFLNPFLFYVVLLKAYSILPAQVAQPLNMTWPIVLVFLSIPLLKQKITLKSIIALFISFIGVFFISSQGNISNFKLNNPFGIFLALGSTIIWSLFWIFNVKDKRDEVVKLFLNFIFAIPFIFIATSLFSKIIIPDFTSLLTAIYVGAFEMGITFVFWLKALKLSKSTDKISILIFLAPFFSLIPIHFIVGEEIYFTTIVGLIIIVLGIFIQQFR